MKKKIYSLILMLMICASSVLLIPNKIEAYAVPPLQIGIGLDYDFVWANIENLSNVVHIYPSEEKMVQGRYMGSWGSNYWSDRLLENMSDPNICNLSGAKKLQLKYIDEEHNGYSSLPVPLDYSISVSHPTKQYPYPNPIPLSELYVHPSSWKFDETSEPTSTFYLNDAKVYDVAQLQLSLGLNWPFGGLLTGYYLNITYDCLNIAEIDGLSNNLIVGKVSYISNEDEIPDNQIGTVFLMEEGQDCQDKLDNITNAAGCILINHGTINNIEDLSKYSYPIRRTIMSENDENLTSLINMLESGEIVFADNMVTPNIITFTYNLEEEDNLPKSGEFIFLWKIRPPSTFPDSPVKERLLKMGNGYRQYWDKAVANMLCILGHVWNQLPFFDSTCDGTILYDFTNTHFMVGCGFAPLPVYSINNSVGTWISQNTGPFIGRVRISGFFTQNNSRETSSKPGVEAYNVVGYRTIPKSPNDEIIVISGRPDGVWGETPGDSGISGSIVLGIAKYFEDFDITPKYNLTFLLTTGEENGFRGAKHFIFSHPETEYKFIKWIGLDQLGFNQVGTNLAININLSKHLDLMTAIAADTNYVERNGGKYGLNFSKVGGRSEDGQWFLFREIDTFCLVKDNESRWDLYQRAGENYAEGDVLKNIDRNDVNLTFELFWNITKYFTVNPDCWFKEIRYTSFDRDDDYDDFDDSIRVNFTMDTILPCDLTRLEVFLGYKNGSEWDEELIDTIDYELTSDGLECSYTYGLSETSEEGWYYIGLDLYNSTGRINQIIGKPTGYNSSTYGGAAFYLYPPSGPVPPEYLTKYFDLYDDINEYWEIQPENMVDGNPMTYAETNICGKVQKLTRLHPPIWGNGDIIKVELRALAHSPTPFNMLVLRPVFNGLIDGDNYYYRLLDFTGPQWSPYFDITNDTNTPFSSLIWTWSDVDNLDCDVEAFDGTGPFLCAKVEVRVTYIPES